MSTAMSAGSESPTIHPFSGVPHRRAASSKMAGSGFHALISAEMQMASNSSTNLVVSSLCHLRRRPVGDDPDFQFDDRSLLMASTVSVGTVKHARYSQW